MIKAKKSLGQNFLTDRDVLKKIINVTNIKDKNIIEVGPGTGNLTSFIIKNNPKEIIVIEKDDYLANKLSETFKNQITVLNDDILNIDENLLFKKKATVFGNLPYNISTEIINKWIINLKEDSWFDCLVLYLFRSVVAHSSTSLTIMYLGRLSQV